MSHFSDTYQHLQEVNPDSGKTLLQEEFDRLGTIRTMVKKSSFVETVKPKGGNGRHRKCNFLMLSPFHSSCVSIPFQLSVSFQLSISFCLHSNCVSIPFQLSLSPFHSNCVSIPFQSSPYQRKRTEVQHTMLTMWTATTSPTCSSWLMDLMWSPSLSSGR